MTDDEILASLQPDEDQAIAIPELEAPEIGATNPTGAVSMPANPALAFEQPTFGPPSPDPTDAIAAGLPPAPTGIPTRDQDQELAPAVPREAPGNVGAPAPLPGMPGAPAGPQGAAPTPDDDIRAGMDQVSQDRAATNEALQRQHEGETEQLAIRADEAAEKRKNAEATLAREQAAQKQYDDAEKLATTQMAQTQQALKDFKFRDLWSSKTTVQKIGAALSSALLAIGAGMMKTPKYAIEILNKEKDDDYKQQLDHLAQLKDQDVMARTGLGDVRAARARAQADITMAAAHKDRVIASQFEETSLRAKDQNSAAEGMAYAAKLKQEADEKDLSAKVQLRTFAMQDAVAKAKAEADALNEEYKRAQIKNLDSLAAMHGRTKPKGSGGGGGGGAAIGGAAEELARRIREGRDGKALTQDEMIHAANELHIPLSAKAGHVSLDSLLKTGGFVAGQARADAKLGLATDKNLEKEVNDFSAQHGVKKLEYSQHKLQEVLDKLNSGNGISAMSSLMEFDAAAKGGTATESSMHAIEGRLGGAWARLKGAFAKGDSGAFGETEQNNLREAVKDALSAHKRSVAEVHDAFGKRFDYSKPGVQQQAAGMFGALGYHGGGGGGHGGSAPAPRRVPADLIEKAKAEVHSNGPHAADARKLLDQQGITVL